MKKIWGLLAKLFYISFRITIWLGVTLFVVGGVLILALREPIPKGIESGRDADDLARSVQLALYYEVGWERSQFIEWSFAGREHLWDRQRGFVRTKWDETTVLFRISGSRAHVTRRGSVVTGAQAYEISERAYEYWVNDSFWLYPARTFFDPGVERGIIKDPQGRRHQLLISYQKGGLSPGDSYLFDLDETRRPVGWRIWNQTLPIGGLYIPWSGMERLASGLWISTEHDLLGLALKLKARSASLSIEELVSPDPFLPIELRDDEPAITSRPSR